MRGWGEITKNYSYNEYIWLQGSLSSTNFPGCREKWQFSTDLWKIHDELKIIDLKWCSNKNRKFHIVYDHYDLNFSCYDIVFARYNIVFSCYDVLFQQLWHLFTAVMNHFRAFITSFFLFVKWYLSCLNNIFNSFVIILESYISFSLRSRTNILIHLFCNFLTPPLPPPPPILCNQFYILMLHILYYFLILLDSSKLLW